LSFLASTRHNNIEAVAKYRELLLHAIQQLFQEVKELRTQMSVMIEPLEGRTEMGQTEMTQGELPSGRFPVFSTTSPSPESEMKKRRTMHGKGKEKDEEEEEDYEMVSFESSYVEDIENVTHHFPRTRFSSIPAEKRADFLEQGRTSDSNLLRQEPSSSITTSPTLLVPPGALRLRSNSNVSSLCVEIADSTSEAKYCIASSSNDTSDGEEEEESEDEADISSYSSSVSSTSSQERSKTKGGEEKRKEEKKRNKKKNQQKQKRKLEEKHQRDSRMGGNGGLVDSPSGMSARSTNSCSRHHHGKVSATITASSQDLTVSVMENEDCPLFATSITKFSSSRLVSSSTSSSSSSFAGNEGGRGDPLLKNISTSTGMWLPASRNGNGTATKMVSTTTTIDSDEEEDDQYDESDDGDEDDN
jgi:hypothetical protein